MTLHRVALLGALVFGSLACSGEATRDAGTDLGNWSLPDAGTGDSGGWAPPDLGPTDLGPWAPPDLSTDLGGWTEPDLGVGPRDAGPTDAGHDEPDVLHDLTELTVEGTVSLEMIGGQAPGVTVTAHCGHEETTVITDVNGRYRVTSDVTRCNRLVVQFQKESFLPMLRVVHLPPPASPVTMDVTMDSMRELVCGESWCVPEGDPVHRFPPGPMARGWISVQDGVYGVDFFPGEFVDKDDRLMWIVGFGYFDFRDRDGRTMESFEPFWECYQVPEESRDQLVDLLPASDAIEMNLYRLDESDGRWENLGPQTYVGLGDTDPETGDMIILPADPDRLGDIRTGSEMASVWVCAPMDRSGWIAWGISVTPKTCIKLEATDQCGRGLPNVVFTIHGRDFGYRAVTWSDRRGEACLEASLSEDPGVDNNFNGLRGETFWVDADLDYLGQGVPYPSLALVGDPGSCARPEGCIGVEQTFEVFGAVCP